MSYRDKYRDQAKGHQNAYDQADAEGNKKSEKLAYSGKYLVKPSLLAFKHKGENITSPRLKDAQTGTVMYNMSLEVTESVGPVKKGDYVYHSFPLWASKEAGEDKKQNIANMAKVEIANLLGHKDVHPDDVDWVIDNLVVEAEDDGDRLKITNTPKIAGKIYFAEVDWDFQNGVNRLAVSDLRVAKEDDVPEVGEGEPAAAEGVAGDVNIPAGNSQDSPGSAPASDGAQTESSVEEDDLPF